MNAERKAGPKRFAARALTVLILLCPPLAAQAGPGISVRIGEFSGEGVSTNELDALKAMISSYVAELDGFRLAGESDAPGMAEDGQAGMVLSGTIGYKNGNYLFSLKSEGDAAKRAVGGTFASVNDIVLRARDLTRRILGAEGRVSPSKGSEARETAKALTLAMLSGTWKGDKGLDRVKLSADGSGSATLSSGHTMKLRSSVDDGLFVIEQDQPGEAAFYASPNYPFETAREIARKARPMRWLFRMSEDGASLSGTKESVAVKRDENGILSIDNGFTRDAVWTRLR